MALIDVHNHILSRAYVDLLAEHGRDRYSLQPDSEGRTVVMRGNARFMTLTEPMFEPELRIPAMDDVGVQTQLLSYTCPNVYWANDDMAEEIVGVMNDHLTEVCAQWPDRFRGLGSIPMQNPDLALKVLDRVVDEQGMVGLILLANVNDMTDEMQRAGYVRIATHDFLPMQSFQIFEPRLPVAQPARSTPLPEAASH